jgi:peptidoglycan hydrolase CwlO-like protein
MSAEVAVLLALLVSAMGVGIPLVVKEFKELRSRLDKANDERHQIKNRQTGVEAKLDMLLHHAGFDVHKVNKAIKEHKEELEENGRPSVGCINITELYQDK